MTRIFVELYIAVGERFLYLKAYAHLKQEIYHEHVKMVDFRHCKISWVLLGMLLTYLAKLFCSPRALNPRLSFISFQASFPRKKNSFVSSL